ncbi:MAG: PilZ domain-containing protein, partial [Myxococcota bacterium]
MLAESPRVALLGDSELDDVRRQLDGLRVEHCEAPRVEFGAQVPLLLSSPPAARDFADGRADAPRHLCHVTVCRDASDLAPADLCLVRPLGDVVLQQLARRRDTEDSERRLARRVSIGEAVKLSALGDRREVRLENVSIGGAGLCSPARLTPETRVEIAVPRSLTGPRSLVIPGRVLACSEHRDGEGFNVSVLFDTLELQDRVTLRALMGRRDSDPAIRSSRTAPALSQRVRTSCDDRRASRRRRFGRRVIGSCEGRGLVLMGRDLDRDGLRVERHVGLSQGDVLRVALFDDPGDPPLLLEARVLRDSAAEGCY